MSRLALFVSTLLLLATGVIGNGASSKLFVRSPPHLVKENGYDHRESLFGSPLYGGSIRGKVHHVEQDLCDSLSMDRYTFHPNLESGHRLTILMVDRGGCTFVKKVRNAQRLGASAVIVADNTCQCSDTECMAAVAPITTCENQEPILADDGSGSDVSIPSFLMFKVDADKVKEELVAGNSVEMEMAWPEVKTTEVTYELYTTPTDRVAQNFLKEFGDIAAALGTSATFTPHMYVYDGVTAGCHSNNTGNDNMCYNLCTNHGRYCATDPDNDLDRGTRGADVVVESLRRICIWKKYGAADGIGAPWWTYVKEFNNHCNTDTGFSDRDCINDVYQLAGIDEHVIESCMQDSGGLGTEDVPNTLLEAEIAAHSHAAVVVVPSFYVQGSSVRGSLNSNDAFRAICAGFTDSSTPSICNTCGNCYYGVKECVANDECRPKPHVPQGKTESVDSKAEALFEDDDAYSDIMESLLSSGFKVNFAKGLGECGLDVGKLMGAASAAVGSQPGQGPDSQVLADQVASVVQTSPACSDDQVKHMRTAFDSFNECSDYDMLELQQMWPSAVVGVIQKCANSMLNSVDLTTGDLDIDSIPQECTNAVLGNNPLGKAIRKILLHPDDTLPCFAKYAKEMPKCSVDVWPMPIDGGMLKLSACVIGKSTPLWEGFCNITLTGLDACLRNDEGNDERDCDAIASSCDMAADGLLEMYFDLPKSLMGLPLPDTCIRMGTSASAYPTIVDRYESWRSQCAEGTSLWSTWENQQDRPIPSYLDFFEGKPSQMLQHSSEATNSSNEKEKGGGAFVSGLVTGLVVVALVIVGVVLVRKRHLFKKGGPGVYDSVVLSEVEMA